MTENFTKKYKLFLDLDGTLADFDRKLIEITGKHPAEMPRGVLWKAMADYPNFFTSLDWMEDGEALWHFSKHLAPTILTGLPNPDLNPGDFGESQKRLWCTRHLGPDVPVICCRSKDKAGRAKEITPEGIIPVLVDDWDRYKSNWEDAGGHFILHRGTDRSLIHLLGLGLLRDDVQA